jgi:hypothetical protein
VESVAGPYRGAPVSMDHKVFTAEHDTAACRLSDFAICPPLCMLEQDAAS